MRTRIFMVASILICAAASGRAEEPAPPGSARSPEVARSTTASVGVLRTAGLLVLVEGLAVANGLMARELPGVYGTLLTVTAPLAASARLNDAGNITAVLGTLAIGQYNFNYVSNRPAAKRRRFWVTFSGLHLVPLLATGIDLLTGGPATRASKPAAASAWHFYTAPASEGMQLALSRRF